MHKITNPIYAELKKLKLISPKNIIKINNKTRDKKINVYKDKKTEIIFLGKLTTGNNYYSSFKYKKIEKIKVSNKKSQKYTKTSIVNDNLRRKKQFSNMFNNKDILDYGCGWGEFLRIIKKARSVNGVELRKECLKYIKDNLKKIKISDDLKNFKINFDVITLFHVLEHLPNQTSILKDLRAKLKSKGKIIIEVPHAKDFLILQDDLKEFKDFTFWREHLILHTENSLRKILQKAGYKNICISYFQRYDFLNHLGWFLKRRPGHHKLFENLFSKNLKELYSKDLIKKKLTDTLIAIAEK